MTSCSVEPANLGAVHWPSSAMVLPTMRAAPAAVRMAPERMAAATFLPLCPSMWTFWKRGVLVTVHSRARSR